MNTFVGQKQTKLIIEKLSNDYLRTLGIEKDGITPGPTHNIYPLLVKAYQAHLDNQRLSLMQACRYVLLQQSATRRKYVEKAIVNGYFETVPCPRDKRRTLLIPTSKLFEHIEAELAKDITRLQKILEACE